MKLLEEKYNIERSDNFQESSFKINATAKAFSILSSGLYTNKIAAVIRELCANAYDSHVAANRQTKPFTVHLPNSLEPEFWVRDYGVGLSHDDIINLYTTYFYSDKTGSNDFIGAMGLGSKSPFAYCENFSVTSFYNGRKYIYSMFLSEEQIPNTALMHEEATDEPNGLLVQLAVQRQDFTKFRTEAEWQLRHYKLRPEIVGQEVKFVEPLINNEFFISYQLSDYQSNMGLLMGNIVYALDRSKFNNRLDAPIINHMMYQGYKYIIIKCNIGDVGISASPEGIEYTPKSLKVVNDKLKEAEKLVREELEQDLNKQPSFWKACEFAESNKKYDGLRDFITYKGKTVRSYFYLEEYCSGITLITDEGDGTFKSSTKREKTLYFKDADKYVFIENDIDAGSSNRVKYFLDESTTEKKAFLLRFKSAQDKDRFFSELEFPANKLISVSTLPKPPKGTVLKVKSKITKFILYKWHSNYHEWEYIKSKPGEQLPSSAFYFEFDKKKQPNFMWDKINYIQSDLKKLGVKLKHPIYGLRTTYYNRVKDAAEVGTLPEWVELLDLAKQTIKDTIADPVFISNLPLLHSEVLKLKSELKNFWLKLRDSLNNLNDEEHIISKESSKLLSLIDSYEKLDVLCHLRDRLLPSQIAIPILTANFYNNPFTNLYAKYPLLEHLVTYTQKCYIDDASYFLTNVSDYIKLVDKS